MIHNKYLQLLGLVILSITMITSCERDVSDDAVLATFPTNAQVFNDAPVGLTDEFFISFDPAGGANVNGFGTDDSESYEGTTSIRIDVPAPNDPDGGFIGGIFRDRGEGRNLTSYDALTFWAKGSTTGVFEAGFGSDFIEDKYRTTNSNLQLSTDWKKYIIPIPDPSKLVQERGMFTFSAGTQSTNGMGFTIWIDEIKFEDLGTVAQPRPRIENGQTTIAQTFIGGNLQVGGLTQTFNTTQGDVTTNITPYYFEFSSSNESVATVNELGRVDVIGSGTAEITATLGGNEAAGSLIIESLGDFTPAPVPARDPENVISVFSDAYDNVPVDYYNGFFTGDGQTTQGGDGPNGADINIEGDGIINYTSLNFVGIGTFLNVPTLDISSMSHLHVDINVNEDIDPGDFITLQLLNDVGGNETSGSVTLNAEELSTGEWRSFDIPLSEFSGLSSRAKIGLLFFISDNSISDIYVDNIYYYKEVVDAQPNVNDEDATQLQLPLGFESNNVSYNFTSFEGADSAVEANPSASGINPTSTVGRYTKGNGAAFFAGSFLDLSTPIDLSNNQTVNMKVYSPKANIPVRLALETAGGENQIFVDTNTTTSNEWEELEFDFSSVYNPAIDYQRVILFFEFIEGTPGDGSTYYFDDIQIID
ncbi:Ig-like domain-containing protein [Psychroflexus salinarum]|uniref:Ig-like domain-containing protein n=1 Tax=Psychroflexus salinarum TaxID=546024 RepID=A0ABW3GQV9_9FLAO